MLVKDEVNSPIFLKGVLHEEFNETKFNEGMEYNWNRLFFEKMDLPKKLWLITTNKIEFDYYEDFLGHIVSNKFLNLIKESNYLQHYVLSSLNIVSTKGKPKVNQPYYFLKFYDREDIVDYEKSDFKTREVPKNKSFNINGIFVEKYNKIILKETDKDIFCLNDLKLVSYLFCSENFKQLCKINNIKGIRFIEIDDIPQYFASLER
ncbi:Imm43 family immunity protein [Lysinibacillus sp. FSL L8-0312]|uniref:Imm43 family immunity protein n=1 Tax=Lysinibacillus sp. FSL L8-0312 TaxID=2921521 RepID=UPI0030F5E46F